MRAERVLSRAADLINRSLREARGPDSAAGTEKLAALALNQRGRVHSPQSHLALKRFHATKTLSGHKLGRNPAVQQSPANYAIVGPKAR
jgi:hypothetical protein